MEKKETLIKTRNFIRVWKMQTLHGKQLKATAERKKNKTSGGHKIYHGPLSQEWKDGRHWSPITDTFDSGLY